MQFLWTSLPLPALGGATVATAAAAAATIAIPLAA